MQKGEKLVAGLLATLLVLVFGIVALGGYVRLSGSGLAIPEWPRFTVEIRVDPATGQETKVKSVFPPTTERGWEILQATFVREIPGYEGGIALNEFKRMFWIEWGHRGLAKLIGVVYLVLLGAVLAFPATRKRFGWAAFGGLLLLVSQAVIGGLVVLTHLRAVKVALHLSVAFIFGSLLLWMLLLIVRPPASAEERKGPNPLLKWALGAYLIVLFQIFSGGLMAGSKAGYMMNTWPMMGDQWIAPGMWTAGEGLFKNFTENVVMIQVFHRWFAFAALGAVLLVVFRALTLEVSRVARWGLRAIPAVVVLQIIIGIVTLLTGVHQHIALTHQVFGLVVLLTVLLVVYEAKYQPVIAEEALAEAAERQAAVETRHANA